MVRPFDRARRTATPLRRRSTLKLLPRGKAGIVTNDSAVSRMADDVLADDEVQPTADTTTSVEVDESPPDTEKGALVRYDPLQDRKSVV